MDELLLEHAGLVACKRWAISGRGKRQAELLLLDLNDWRMKKMCIHKRILTVAAVLALAFAVVGGGNVALAGDPPETTRTTALYTLNEDGTYSATAVYLVDPDEAMAAYVASGLAPEADGEQLYSVDVLAEEGTHLGSAEGWVDFLESNYPKLDPDRMPPCDATVILTYILACPFNCDPPSNCNARVVFVAIVTCPDPCPPGMVCAPFASRIVSITTDIQACQCIPNDPTGACTNMGASVIAFTSVGPVCECIPFLEWYFCEPDDIVGWIGETPIVPGADVIVHAETPAWMSLHKQDTTASVSLTHATVSAQIGEIDPETGLSEVTVTGGGGQFNSYLWDTVPVPTSDFTVLSGQGYINWEQRHVTGELRARVTAFGFVPIWAVAQGQGTLYPEENRIELALESSGYEIGAIPAVSGLGLIVMTLLVLTAGMVVLRRVRRRRLAAA